MNYAICRPGMIVGHSQTGRIKSFNTIYYVLKLIFLKKINTIPVSKNQKLDIIPVDDVARGVVKATFSKAGENRVFHLTCPYESAPTVYELSEYVKNWAATNLLTLMPYFFDEHTYRELGIEIHNAYGQTEAPLITINRKGDNIIPTIGTELPKTSIEVEEDGELIVRGPQVALGYYGLETDTMKDGVLRTGDLGFVDEYKHFSLIGRKKEMIITAYGKNINCPKIEERLKDIDVVSEAVLIGENRPYCTALLWLEEGREKEQDGIKQAIAEMNAHLSHPEQIREYRVIEKPLSIKAGELTPNLKVRRNQVENHYQAVIEEMYQKP